MSFTHDPVSQAGEKQLSLRRRIRPDTSLIDALESYTGKRVLMSRLKHRSLLVLQDMLFSGEISIDSLVDRYQRESLWDRTNAEG